MPPTMRDIARQCDVSVQTVSRILRGHEHAYRPETVRRVLAAARALGYRPPWASVRHRGADRPFIGVILSGWEHQLMPARLHSIEQAARHAGYRLQVATTGAVRQDHGPLAEVAEDLATQGARALVVMRSRPVSPETRRRLKAMPLPVIFVGWGPPRWNGRIVFDRKSAAEQIASHLAELGHRRVAFMARAYSLDFLEHRFLPFQRAFAQHGMTLVFDREWIIDPDDDVAGETYRAVVRMVSAPAEVTAIAASDALALVALAALRDVNVEVPAGMSVVGFGDHTAGRFSDPPLTTVRQGGGDLGAAVMNMLQTLLDRPEETVEQVVRPYDLVVRGSTGPACPEGDRSSPRGRSRGRARSRGKR